MAQQPLLRDVIDIKESISTSDFVLSLAEATTPEGAEAALRDYVVTDRLRDNFDEALGYIRAALEGRTSKAVYLHGSFGSGKSHFMAVLHALLTNHPAVCSRGDFDPVLTKHEWLASDGRKFLLVPYHMLGAKAMEQRVLGDYVRHVRTLHPDAPVPQVYRTDALFDTLRSLRGSMGDAMFIKTLSGPEDEDEEWEDESFEWTPELLDTALSAPEAAKGAELNLVDPSSPAELRARLVDDASTRLVTGFADDAAENEHGFVSLDRGLSVIAEHARSLGYDGLVLFLDELILWLAGLLHDQKFLAREANKLSLFVESGDAQRAIPIVSFIARQRDLRELLGEEAFGAAEHATQDIIDRASGRIDPINLEDRNLPQITQARLLQPREGKARLIDEAFERTKRAGGPQVWDTLLGSDQSTTGADEASFRLTYPFSPAFMDTLVHLSSALQRSRTGLKVMGQLLADHRDSLRLGDLVAVGDLYPLIAQGGERPFTDNLKSVFEAADKLYRNQIRPYLLNTYSITDDDVDQYANRPESIGSQDLKGRCRAFSGDNRLVCTLLLSALAPSAPALNDLTIRRLAALNHGSIVSPLPDGEVGIVQNKVAEWAARFPEIKETGTTTNPGVRLELTGVDVNSVVQNADVNDNAGNRRALAKRLLAEELGVERVDGRLGADELHLVWRGSQRTVEVLFGNVADSDELPDHDMQPQMENQWRIIVDLPYDEEDRNPADDVNRITTLRERQGQGRGELSQTVAWIPTHLSAQRWADFRRLVKIDRALADDARFANQYAAHLNADNKERAKGLLQSQRKTLLRQVKAAFKQAYGLGDKQAENVTLGFDDHFHALPDVGGLKVSIGQSMRDGIRHIAGKLLAHQFPKHPDFDPDDSGKAVRTADARTVFTHVQAAANSNERRVEVPAKDRAVMKRVAEPLGLGQQKEAYFELSGRWAEHFRARARAEGETGDLSLTRLTDWTDVPEPMGLEPFLTALVAASFGEYDDRVWVRGGVPLDPVPELSRLRPSDALRDQPRPAKEDWDRARERFEAIFGEKAPSIRRGRMVNHFAGRITARGREFQGPAADLVRKLEEHAAFLGLDGTEDSDRMALARRAVALLDELTDRGQSGSGAAKRTIEALARFDLGPVSADRYGTSIKQADKVAQALSAASWDVLKLARGQGAEGESLLESLRGVARDDQRTADLEAALERTRREVTALIERNQREEVRPETMRPRPRPEDVDLGGESSHPPVPDTLDASSGQDTGSRTGAARRSGTTRTAASEAVRRLQNELAALAQEQPGATVEITWQVVD
ncbi:BREX-2 system ATPase PglY [Nocardiopsis sp. LOL_012]|uniref:BREX-2 system ATPase PglY n=1 Tax=Nocardiopsis sp. LOL_012 TaxID=3345409 RepID=UPI003A8588B8